MSNKISKELMAKDEAVEAVSMEELEDATNDVSKMGKVSEKLMAEDKPHEAISMEELEAEASDVKIGGIKYQNIIDTLHKLKLSDEEIKNLPAETVATLNAYGALSEASKRLFTKEYEEAEAKRDMWLIDFFTTHKDPFKELYEAAIKK